MKTFYQDILDLKLTYYCSIHVFLKYFCFIVTVIAISKENENLYYVIVMHHTISKQFT